jgi:hypothetical protein
MGSQPDLRQLARAAAAVAAEWDLRLGPPFALGRYSYVAPAGPHSVLGGAYLGARPDECDVLTALV